MKPCPHCGKELPQEMQFCPYCMEKLITETVIGDTPVRRRRRWWLWLIIVLLLWLLLCGLWLWRPWQSPSAPERESTIASTGSSVTTTSAAASANSYATQTTHPTQPEATASTTTTQSTSTSHTTTSTNGIGTNTTSRVTSRATSTTSGCAAGHDWQAVTQTVHVEEKGHYETKTVEKRLTLFRCALCYKEFGTLEDYYDHFDSQHDGDSLQAIFRDCYETVTEYREVEEQQWVVDTPAHDKTVTVGRRCRVCGKTETNQDKE